MMRWERHSHLRRPTSTAVLAIPAIRDRFLQDPLAQAKQLTTVLLPGALKVHFFQVRAVVVLSHRVVARDVQENESSLMSD